MWNDFNLEQLNHFFGITLDLEIPAEQMARAPRTESLPADFTVNDARDVRQMVEWNRRLMQPTLGYAKTFFGLHPGVALQQRPMSPDRPEYVNFGGGGRPVMVHHQVMLDTPLTPNLVVGLARKSTHFKGRQVIEDPATVSEEGRWPLRQLANLCDKSKTRYGYLITDEDLTVCCFHEIEPAVWGVQLLAIPWTLYGPEQLTSDLALWWLSMIALCGPGNRATTLPGVNIFNPPYFDPIFPPLPPHNEGNDPVAAGAQPPQF